MTSAFLREPAGARPTLFHVRLSRLLRSAEAFNLSGAELASAYIEPWRAGVPIFLNGRRWDPETARITIYEGPRLTKNQQALGLGWSKVTEFGEDVTDEALRRARP